MIIREAKRSDLDSIEQIYNEAYKAVYWTAMAFMKNEADAEDIVQDCFVKMLEGHPSDCLHDSHEMAAPLLFRIVHNRCIDELRRYQPQVPIPTDMAEDDVESSFVAARLWTAIDTLPDRCREVFLMAKRDGMTYREIAEELGISERTVEHQVSKALRILRGKSQDFFRLVLLTLSA